MASAVKCMMSFPTNRNARRRWSAQRRFNGWLATGLQDRRRGRAFVAPESSLLTGLTHFYQPQVGATHLRSWNEDANVPSEPFLGFDSLSLEGGGGYVADDFVQYFLFPFGDKN